MKGLINIKNNDNKYFLWCHDRHLNLLKIHPERMTKKDKKLVGGLDYENINFPVSKKDYCKLEVQNTICINVKLVYPVYLLDQEFCDNMDLLLI